jgi:hypothetical protein
MGHDTSESLTKSRIVGHESSAMSYRYTHVGREARERAAASMPEIGGAGA